MYTTTDNPVKKTFILNSVIGIGATSLVYECTLDENLSWTAAVKFQEDAETFIGELNSYEKFKTHDICPTLYGSDTTLKCLLVQKGIPVKATIDGVRHSTLNKKHFRQLLNHLKAVHSLGYVHRDVRLTNIILLDDGKIAKFCDFGSVCEKNKLKPYNGSRETASQDIILQRHHCKEWPFNPVFDPIDDYESLLKCYLLWVYNLKIPNWTKYSELYYIWCEYLQPIFSNNDIGTEEKFVAYLEKTFADTPEIPSSDIQAITKRTQSMSLSELSTEAGLTPVTPTRHPSKIAREETSPSPF